MLLTNLRCKSYKSFRDEVHVDLPPLTIVLGKNNAGKSALVRLPLLLLKSLASNQPEPVSLQIGDLSFGGSTVDLNHGRSPHGAFSIGGSFVLESGERLSADASVQQVTSLGRSGQDEFSFISSLNISGAQTLRLEWDQESKDPIMYFQAGKVEFQGLLPTHQDNLRDDFNSMLLRISYLGPLRKPVQRDIRAETKDRVGMQGENAPHLLRANTGLLKDVGDWYRQNMEGWTIDIEHSGPVFSCVARLGDHEINLADTGQGFGQVLPVIVQQFRHRASSAKKLA